MNYRHAFHAGNHADVLKHAALCLVLARLRAKEKPFAVIDTHAGRGLYDLASPEAARSPEFETGIARLIAVKDAPAALGPYLEIVRAHNPFAPSEGPVRWYPGSPAIAREALRAGDSLKLCERHPAEAAALTAALRGEGAAADARVKIFEMDGYEAVRAFLPPPERRGLVLMDPPFEAPGEFDRIARALEDGARRWASGVFMVWHPIKDGGEGADLFARRPARLEKFLRAELCARAPDGRGLAGSGLLFANPPFGMGEALADALPYLARLLTTGPGARWRLVAGEGEAATTVEGEI